MSLPGMTEEGARKIIAYRKTNPITNVATLSSLAGIDYFLYERLFTFTNGNTHVLKASTDFGENSRYIIECHVLKRYGTPRERWRPFEIQYWKEKIE